MVTKKVNVEVKHVRKHYSETESKKGSGYYFETQPSQDSEDSLSVTVSEGITPSVGRFVGDDLCWSRPDNSLTSFGTS